MSSFYKKHLFPFLCAALVVLSIVPARAEPRAEQPDPLTVTGVIVDKTAANAVVAREEAVLDARRLAFRKLAKAHMSAEAATDLPLPDDAKLATLIQDFEIKRERLSSTRYVGDFTVRFREGVRAYIPVPLASAPMEPAASPDVTGAVQAPDARAGVLLAEPVLILPYLQDIAGKMVLWGEPNPWRGLWQSTPPQPVDVLDAAQAQKAQGKVIVPLGDVADVSAGSDSAVWSGNYAAIDALRSTYGVTRVVLAVANRSGPVMRVDLYEYAGSGLQRRARLEPVIDPASDDTQAFSIAARAVLKNLLTGSSAAQGAEAVRDQSVAAVSRDLVGQSAVSAPMVVSGSGTQIQASMRFDDFMTWMETQKRIADIAPPVRVSIQTISREQSRFTLSFAGDIAALTAALATQGLSLVPSANGSAYTLTLNP